MYSVAMELITILRTYSFIKRVCD